MARVPTCHPDRKHQAFGFCGACYQADRRTRWTSNDYEKERNRGKAKREKYRDKENARTRERYYETREEHLAKRAIKYATDRRYRARILEQSTAWHKANRARANEISAKSKRKSGTKREYNLQTKFGLSIIDVDKIIKNQNGKCPICMTEVTYGSTTGHVDHDHKTGSVRSILCPACNKGLGHFSDSVTIIRRAVRYLEKHN